MRVIKIEVLVHQDGGNGIPQLGTAVFDDGKTYQFTNAPNAPLRFMREHHRADTLVMFASRSREEAFFAALNDDRVELTRSPYYAS